MTELREGTGTVGLP